MSKIPFNVHAYTARLIGRVKVSKLEGAMIELVKNTYDADASICARKDPSLKSVSYSTISERWPFVYFTT